ncbi:hypothetical protein [Peptoniphilus asaccharolyticus]
MECKENQVAQKEQERLIEILKSLIAHLDNLKETVTKNYSKKIWLDNWMEM